MIISDLPFIWRLTDQPNATRPASVPRLLDFEWDWDNRFGLLRQKVTSELRSALAAVYSAGSSNLGAVEGGSGVYAEVQRFVAFRNPGDVVTVLDIGGGRISRFRNLPGCSPYNVDPSAQFDMSDTLTTQHVKCTFPAFLPADWPEHFDFVVLDHVLEHVEDPLAVLQAAATFMNDGSCLLASVPDCTLSVDRGDISIATPQHLSYFTNSSFRALFYAAGLSASGTRQEAGQLRNTSVKCKGRISQEMGSFGRFIARAVPAQMRIADILTTFDHDLVGVYAPMRLLPFVDNIRSRLFDDGMAGRYLDGVNQKIEGIADFNANPVDLMFVMSHTYEREIVAKLAGRCKVITLTEMLDV